MLETRAQGKRVVSRIINLERSIFKSSMSVKERNVLRNAPAQALIKSGPIKNINYQNILKKLIWSWFMQSMSYVMLSALIITDQWRYLQTGFWSSAGICHFAYNPLNAFSTLEGFINKFRIPSKRSNYSTIKLWFEYMKNRVMSAFEC